MLLQNVQVVHSVHLFSGSRQTLQTVWEHFSREGGQHGQDGQTQQIRAKIAVHLLSTLALRCVRVDNFNPWANRARFPSRSRILVGIRPKAEISMFDHVSLVQSGAESCLRHVAS